MADPLTRVSAARMNHWYPIGSTYRLWIATLKNGKAGNNHRPQIDLTESRESRSGHH